MSDEDMELLARIEREGKIADRIAAVVAAVLFLAWALLLLVGCAHPRPRPRYHPDPPPMVEAHLDVFPQITIAGRDVMLVAWLSDPEAVIACPSLTWTWDARRAIRRSGTSALTRASIRSPSSSRPAAGRGAAQGLVRVAGL